MTEFDRTQDHTILPVDRRGNTLVLRPVGDLAGFSPATFAAEMGRVKSLLKDPAYRNVIVDLSASRYFGSEMIGQLVGLQRTVQEHCPDGVMALAGLSSDMQAGLDIMKVSDLWLTFDTANQAISKIASESVGQRLRRHGRQHRTLLYRLAAIAVGVGLALLVMMTPLKSLFFSPPAVRDYRLVASVYGKWRELRDARLSGEERADFEHKLLIQLEPLRKTDDETDKLSEGHRKVIFAAKEFQKALREGRPENAQHSVAQTMDAAHDLLERHTGVSLDQLPDAEDRRKRDEDDHDASPPPAKEPAPKPSAEAKTGDARQ